MSGWGVVSGSGLYRPILSLCPSLSFCLSISFPGAFSSVLRNPFSRPSFIQADAVGGEEGRFPAFHGVPHGAHFLLTSVLTAVYLSSLFFLLLTFRIGRSTFRHIIFIYLFVSLFIYLLFRLFSFR